MEAQIRRTAETGTFFGKGEWVLDLKDNWSGYELTKFVGLAADISSDHRQEAVRLLEEFLPLVLDAQPLDLRSCSEGMTLYLSLTEEPQRKLDVEPEAISRLSSDLADNPSEQSGYSALFAAKTYQARLEQESWDRATRILAAALISLEPELPADSHLRQKLRREYAAAVWQGLQAQRAAKRHQLVSRIPPSEGWLETFAQGSTETFVDDLLDVLYRFPVPPKPYPGDLLVADFDEITEKSATNGPGNQPGKAIVGKWGGHEVSLASNVISVQEYHLLQGTGEEDREAGPGEEGQPGPGGSVYRNSGALVGSVGGSSRDSLAAKSAAGLPHEAKTGFSTGVSTRLAACHGRRRSSVSGHYWQQCYGVSSCARGIELVVTLFPAA
ncbi:hypothetical protein [Labrenzia sp. VG12]|uniref:hypothetical protein n=1 Tax=Labrenzia sp. VG12 TaxID=2021862 RepID=UPI000B8C4C6C|nr:hypothetical protein [Labrenzia sp. VG12]ASP33554.1 hypothetical protein CHH27_10100 [Labrenzia sp. VG12]